MKLSKSLALIALVFIESGAPAFTQSPGPQVIELAAEQHDFIITPKKKAVPIDELSQHHQAIASGDLNGDGIGDMVMGGAGRIDVPPIAGQAYVIYGPLADGGLADLTNPAHVGVRLVGADAGDMFGWSVAVADLNADGQDDLIVGAIRGDGAANARADAGDAYVFFGPLAGVISATDADVTVHGVDPGDFLGWSFGTGDVSGDGLTDLILGARDGDGFGNALVGRAGEVHVLFGPLGPGVIDLATTPADVTVFGGTENNLGASVAAGDVTGDTVADLVMGAPRSNSRFGGVNRGDTHVLFGPLASGAVVNLQLAEADLSISGVRNSDRIGTNVVVADVTGDGIGDLITSGDIVRNLIPGSPNFNLEIGAVYALFGPVVAGTHILANASDLAIFIPDAPGAGMISSVDAGDVNGDGARDLLIGARTGIGSFGPPPLGKSAPGEAYAVFGPFSSGSIIDLETTSPDITVNGKYFSGQLGVSVATGDVSGDGVDDLLLEASFAQYPGSGIGEGYVIFGTSPNRPATTLSLTPMTSTATVGQEHCVIANAGDASGNPPVPEVAIRFSVTGATGTQASSITNADGEASFCYTGTVAGLDSISAFADTNGDGVHDAGEPAGTAQRIYLAGDPASLNLTPSSASSVVDTAHCTTALVMDQFGNAVPGMPAAFSADGIAAAAGSVATGATGEAVFCYSSPLPGESSIHAYADTDRDGVPDAGEPAANATTAWALPSEVPGCERVHGAGSIVSPDGRAHFAFDARNKPKHGELAGMVTYHVGGTRFRAEGITHLAVVGQAMTIHGVGRDGRGPLVPFRIDASDQEPDTFRMTWPGYVAEGEVGGKLRVHARCEG